MSDKLTNTYNFILKYFILLSPFFYGFVFFTGHNINGDNEIKSLKDYVIIILLIYYFLKSLSTRRISYNSIDIIIYIIFVVGILKLLILPNEFSLKITRTFIQYTLFYLLVKRMFIDYKHLNAIIKGIILSSLIVSIIGILEYFMGSIPTVYSKAAGQIRIISTLYNPNSLGWFLCLISSMILGMIVNKNNDVIINKTILITIYIINIIAIFMSGSRSALFILLIISLFVFLAKKRILILYFLGFTTLLFIYIFYYLNINIYDFRILASGIESEREYIYQRILSEAYSLNFSEIIFGVNSRNLLKLEKLSLLLDSQLIIDFVLGGIFYILLKYSFIIITLFTSFNKIKKNPIFLSLSLFLISSLFLMLLGNITNIFPHGIYIWMIISIVNTKHYENKFQRALS